MIGGERPGRARQEQLRARRRRLDGPLRRLRAALSPLRLRDAHARRRRRRLADRLRGAASRTTSASSASCRSPARTGRGATRTATRTPPHPISGGGRAGPRGRARARDRDARRARSAIPNGTFGNRPHCIYRGFCLQGCKVNAKASPLVTHLPDALAHGVEVRADCHAVRVEIDEAGRCTGVTYVRDGRERFQRAAAVARRRLLDRDAAAAAELDQPRASRTGWPTTTTRSGATSWSRARRRSPGASPTRCACTRRRRRRSPPSSSTRPTRRAASRAASRSRPSGRCRSAGPSTCSPTATGATRCASTCATTTTGTTLGVLNELLPQPENRVTLADETDAHGMPVARMDYTPVRQRPRQHRLRQATCSHDIWEAAGAQDMLTIDRYAHLVGGCRMGTAPENSVDRRRPPRLGRAEPVRRRRQRDADPGLRQPGADDHGARLAAGRPARRKRTSRPRASKRRSAPAGAIGAVGATVSRMRR